MKNKIAKFIGGALVGLAVAASAQARTISLDSDPGTPGLQPLTSTSINRLVVHNVGETVAQGFPDQIRFRVNGNNDAHGGYNVGLSFVNVPLVAGGTTLRDITGLTFSLYKAVGAIGIGGGADMTVCNPCSGTSFNQALLGGLYYAVVTGTLAGTLGGMYALTAAATVVPLPPAAWLLAAGLAGLVGIARRRKQIAAAEVVTTTA